jgi:hypothetical protein
MKYISFPSYRLHPTEHGSITDKSLSIMICGAGSIPGCSSLTRSLTGTPIKRLNRLARLSPHLLPMMLRVPLLLLLDDRALG